MGSKVELATIVSVATLGQDLENKDLHAVIARAPLLQGRSRVAARGLEAPGLAQGEPVAAHDP